MVNRGRFGLWVLVGGAALAGCSGEDGARGGGGAGGSEDGGGPDGAGVSVGGAAGSEASGGSGTGAGGAVPGGGGTASGGSAADGGITGGAPGSGGAAAGGGDASADAAAGGTGAGGASTGAGGAADAGAGGGSDGGTCQDECTTVDARSCDAGGFRICGNYDGDGCLEWGAVQACQGTATCSNGYCSVQCTDECTAIGATECGLTGVRTCGLHDGDACLDLSADVPCPSGQACSNGTCSSTCADECASAGLTQCGVGGVQTCGTYDADSCLEWGTPVSCGPAGSCVDGACETVPPPVVVVSEVLFNSEGADTSTFIELHGPPGLDASGLSLAAIAGSDGSTVAILDLTGAFGSDGLFLVVHPQAPAAWRSAAEMIAGFADLGNGPDSLQLRWGQEIVDAVGYGDFTSAVFAGEGTPVSAPPAGYALARDGAYTDTDDNAADFSATASPSPGATNPAPNTAPNAELSCPARAFVGDAVVLDGTGSTDAEGIAQYAFFFGDGTSSAGAASSVVHTFGSPDVYVAELRVTDLGGATDRSTCQILVEEDLCAGVACVTPPANTCVDAATARRYSPTGQCAAGQCTYGAVTVSCPDSCQAGACVAGSCGGTVCDSPPADVCASSTTLRRFAQFGTCNVNVCAYQEIPVFCSEGCFAGACIAGSWETEFPPLATAAQTGRPVIAVDALETPHIAACPNDLVYRTRTAYGWEETVVDSLVGSSCEVAIGLDGQGAPMIAYQEEQNLDLRFAWMRNGAFELHLVDTQGDAGRAPSVSLSPAGDPVVAYIRDQELWTATLQGSSWTRQRIGALGPTTPPTYWVSDIAWGPGGELYVLAGVVRGINTGSGALGRPVDLFRRVGAAWTSLRVDDAGIIGRDSLRVMPDATVRVLHAEASSGSGGPTNVRWTTVSDMRVVDAIPGPFVIAGTGELFGVFDEGVAPRFALRSDSMTFGSYVADGHGFWSPMGNIPNGNGDTSISDANGNLLEPLQIVHTGLEWTVLPPCVPDCSGKSCGVDLCGGSCGTCSGPGGCDDHGVCSPWQYEWLTPWDMEDGAFVGTELAAIGTPTNGDLLHSHGLGAGTMSQEEIVPGLNANTARVATDIDPSGQVHVLVAPGASPTLYTSNGVGWTGVPVGALSGTPFVMKISVDALGHLHIAYQYRIGTAGSSPYRLMYAYWDGSTMTNTEIAALAPNDSSIAIQLLPYALDATAAGTPHLVFGMPVGTRPQVRHATNASGSWQVTPVYTGLNLGSYQAWAEVDASGALHVLYRVNNDTEYAKLPSGGAFGYETLAGVIPYWATVGQDEQPLVVERVGLTNGSYVIHARTAAGTWTPETVHVRNAAAEVRLVAPPNDTWHLFYDVQASQNAARHAWRPRP